MSNPSAHRKIFITGTNGILGHALVGALRDKTHIVGFDCSLNRIPEIDFIQGDISKASEIGKAIKSEKPDFVIHCAAFTNVDGCEVEPEKAFKINSEGTKNAVSAAREARACFIYISTDYVFDGKKLGCYLENDPPRPLSIYGKSKYLGEQYVREAGAGFLLVRTSWLYGLHGKNFVEAILEKARQGATLDVVKDQIGRPTYAKDLAVMLEMILMDMLTGAERTKSWRNSIVHIANIGEVSWFGFAREIVKLGGFKDVLLRAVDSTNIKRPAPRPKNSVLCTDKCESAFPGVLRSWTEALKEFIGERMAA